MGMDHPEVVMWSPARFERESALAKSVTTFWILRFAAVYTGFLLLVCKKVLGTTVGRFGRRFASELQVYDT